MSKLFLLPPYPLWGELKLQSRTITERGRGIEKANLDGVVDLCSVILLHSTTEYYSVNLRSHVESCGNEPQDYLQKTSLSTYSMYIFCNLDSASVASHTSPRWLIELGPAGVAAAFLLSQSPLPFNERCPRREKTHYHYGHHRRRRPSSGLDGRLLRRRHCPHFPKGGRAWKKGVPGMGS